MTARRESAGPAGRRPRVVVLGAGFGGYHCLRTLEGRLPRDDVTFVAVNPADYMLYVPLLPEVAAARLEPRRVAVPLRARLPRTQFVLGNAAEVDLAGRMCTVVDVEHGVDGGEDRAGAGRDRDAVGEDAGRACDTARDRPLRDVGGPRQVTTGADGLCEGRVRDADLLAQLDELAVGPAGAALGWLVLEERAGVVPEPAGVRRRARRSPRAGGVRGVGDGVQEVRRGGPEQVGSRRPAVYPCPRSLPRRPVSPPRSGSAGCGACVRPAGPRRLWGTRCDGADARDRRPVLLLPPAGGRRPRARPGRRRSPQGRRVRRRDTCCADGSSRPALGRVAKSYATPASHIT